MRPNRRLPLFLSLTVVALLLAPSTALGGAFPGANGRLVFERGQLLHTNPDGSGQTTITSPQYYASEPAAAPDGNRIAFAYAPARVGVSGYGIWVINADGTGARQVTTDPETVARGDSDPAWSPDGSKIAFVRGQSGTGISDLLVMNADGSGGTTNLTATFAGSVNDPEWSPAGDRIAFSSGFDVFLVGADGASPPVQITPRGGLARGYPSWSPDGSRIAYKQGGEIRVTSPDGTNNVLLAGGFREIWEIAWSPDGSKIALINDPGTDITVQEELFIMNADGTGAARPATRVDTNTTLDWGRQGTLLPPPQPGTVPPPVSAPASPPEPEAVARPALGESFQARVLSGEVLVSVPSGTARASQSVPGLKGRRFVPLGRLRTLPIGSLLDARRGSVRLTSARDSQGTTQSGDFSAGVFQVLQTRRRAAKGLTELRLNGFSFRSCGRGQGSGASARSSRVSRRTIRSLRAKANGRFRTRGRYSAATVRGTEWVTTDRCDGTLTKVTRGRVAVRDFRRKKTVLVRAGKSYLARGRR